MSVTAWLDGQPLGDPEHALAVTNRGLHYGDGLFETMLLRAGQIRFLDIHVERMKEGCRRLGIALSATELLQELTRLPHAAQPAIVKLLLFRTGTGRGYRPPRDGGAMRLMLLYPWTEAPAQLRVQWCASRWSRNPQLAGLKHLNRLEQVLAQAELNAAVDEGLMLDTEGELVSATSGNVFLVERGKLRTPDLRACGVKGVMRTQVIAVAKASGLTVEECALWPTDFERADEAFVTNALRGVRPITQLDTWCRPVGPVVGQLQRVLKS